MASYIPAPSETLHLMQNQGYGGGTCADASGNLMLIPHESTVDMNDPRMGYLMSQMQIPNMSSPLSTPIRMYSSAVQQQSSPNLLSTGHINGNGTPNFSNWSAATNEFAFLPSTETTQMNHPLAARLTSNMMASDQLQLGSNLAHFNFGHRSVQDHEQQASMMNKEAALRLNMASCAPTVVENMPHQSGLSLSLSSLGNPMQMQFCSRMPSGEPIPGLTHAHAGEEYEYKEGMKMLNADMGTVSAGLRSSLANGAPVQAILHNYANDASRQTNCVQQPEYVAGAFSRSKYLKAAQCLLDEVVTVVDVIKRKHDKTDQPSSKEGITLGLSMMKAAPSGDLVTSVNADQLALQDKQQLQMKKARLISMLEEVDRRYKVYHIQMQTIINSFESVAGANAAHSYTALALQTISKHFRSLRDAISGQIRVMGKALGEETQPSNYQHRAFQQLQLMQQHAWRPQRGLPERAVSILRAWLFEHFLHPYPKDADKVMLANQTGLTRNQVSNWFINARVRLWKPMVEEMYQEEAKDSDGPQDEKSNDTARDIEDVDLKEASASLRNPASNSSQSIEHSRLEDRKNLNDESQREVGLHHQLIRIADRNSTLEETNIDSDLLPHNGQCAKKSRGSIIEGFGLKTEVYDVHNLKGDYEMKEYGKMSWGMETSGSMTTNPDPTLTRERMLMPRNSVSLTLGLQNSDPLEVPCQQQPYLQQESGHNNSRYISHQISSSERQDIDKAAGNGVQDYYFSMAAANTNSNNELFSLLQNRKGFVGNVLQHGFTS